MGRRIMRIGILTSSRADFGIYQPLINELVLEKYFFNVEIIAFGTHLSKYHGFTLSDIKNKYNIKIHEVSSLLVNDSQASVATSYGLTTLKFADFWDNNIFDLVFCLGDRFEMNAAVQTGIPFGVKFAHIHGGETTLGAIDNIYRHQISLASQLHFTSTEKFKERVTELIQSDKNVYNVGALSLSEIDQFIPLPKHKLLSAFNIKDESYCLVTFHPETNAFDSNEKYALEMKKALAKLTEQINLVITMPNADTMGSVYREQLFLLKEEKNEKVFLVENFGKENYFSAMYYSDFLLGNTSSGIIEAASFNKYVVNVGDRQKGRLQSENVINAKFDSKEILASASICLKQKDFSGENRYYKKGTSKEIVEKIKNYEEL
ncbi:UDP-N-acetylglucosamine 2-epimerase [Tenacibaculum aestuarii]|uniref:UDP-N-acetylglucosamine 2-epimerase n=1 Tax=Tenacibaculum aestuarii TaxID=362781 RepID=UPI0038960B49